MFEEQISEIRNGSCSSFDEFILQRYDAFEGNDGNIDAEDKRLLEGFLRIREAMNLHLQNGTQNISQEIRDTLAGFNLEVDTFVCSLEQDDAETLATPVSRQEIPIEYQEVLNDAISGLFGSASISEIYGGDSQEQEFIDTYTSIIQSYGENDFLFELSEAHITRAHQFLRDNGINRNYNPSDRRSNYILGIVNREIIERGLEIEIIQSYERNLTSRVVPILNNFDERGIYPQISSFEEANELIADGELVLIDSELWTLDNSIVSKSGRNNQEGLVYADLSVLVLMHVVIDMLRAQGTDYVPNVGSLLRPIPYNNALPGASPNSPHIQGLGVDFDLGSPDLEAVLQQLDSAGYIVLTIESDHYHITIINPDGLQQDFPDIIPDEIPESDIDREYLTSLLGENFSAQIGSELSELLLDSLWNTIQDSPLEYIDPEQRLLGENNFLQSVFGDFINLLSETQKNSLVDSNTTLDINIFFKVSSGVLRRGTRRVHFSEIISPISYPESDQFSQELQDNRTISDLEFLGFSRDIVMQELFGDSAIDLGDNTEIIERNITEFYRFFMHMESDFRNVCNENSSACGYHQILGGVIGGIENTSLYNSNEGRYTSFQEYLNRVHRLLNGVSLDDEYIYSESFSLHRSAALDSLLYSPQALSGSEQSFLVLGALLHKARTNPSLQQELQRVFLFGDINALSTIYADYHHTDRSHRATGSRLNTILPTYSEYLATPNPSLEIMNLSVQLQLNNLIGNQSVSEDEISGDRAQILQRFLLMLGYEISDLEFSGEMVRSFGPSTQRALIQFQIDSGLIDSADDSAAGLFGPGTKREIRKRVLESIELISSYSDEFIGPPIAPGLRASDIITVFSR